MKIITLLEIADWLAEKLSFEDVTAGNTDASKECTIGVYQREPFTPRKCIGGTESYQTVKLRLLVHWTDSPTKAEIKANEIAEMFESLYEAETAEHIMKFAEVKAIRSIGKDEKGICEYIVDTDIIYTDKEE